jgi:hypothetical protein
MPSLEHRCLKNSVALKAMNLLDIRERPFLGIIKRPLEKTIVAPKLNVVRCCVALLFL